MRVETLVMIQAACECGVRLSGESEDDYAEVFLRHVRSAHPDWPYPDESVRFVGAATLRLTGGRDRLESIGTVTIEPATAERVDDWASFFDHDAFVDRPWLAACYCLEPMTVPGEAPPQTDWRGRRAAMIDLFESGAAFGYLAYVDGRVAGWVNAAARAHQRLHARGPGSEPADSDVIAVSCFNISPPYRSHGIAPQLLDAVIAGAADRAMGWIEGYPLKESERPGGWSFRGAPSLFESRGFGTVAVRGRDTVVRRPV